MELNQPIGSKMPSQEHLNFINKLNDAKIPRQSQLIANRLFMKNFPREVRKTKVKTRLKISFIYLFQTTGAEIENWFQAFGEVHDVKIIAKENTYVYFHSINNITKHKTVFPYRHFAFISFVNDDTALEVLRQHAIVPLTFQNRPIILAPAYKKPSVNSLTSRQRRKIHKKTEEFQNFRSLGPTSYYSSNGTTMTPPPTPSRSTVNGNSQQPSTPYQQPMSAPHPIYSPIFLPVQANVNQFPMFQKKKTN